MRVRIALDHTGQRASEQQMSLIDGDLVLELVQTERGTRTGRPKRLESLAHNDS